VETLLEIIQIMCPTAFPDAVGFLRQQIDAYPPIGEDPDPEGFPNFRAKKRAATKCKTEGENSDNNREEGTSWKRRRICKRVADNEMDVDTDVPVRNQSVSRTSVPAIQFAETDWPEGLCMGSSPLSDVEGVASPSGLTAEEKEKEKTPGEMEIEDVAGPSGNPAENVAPTDVPVKMEIVEENLNQVRCKVVEVLPSEPAQPVIEDAPAPKETQPATTVEKDEAVVEPVLPPVIKPWDEDTRKELKITTRKNEDSNEVIEILNSDNEMPVEGKGKEKRERARRQGWRQECAGLVDKLYDCDIFLEFFQ
jgi:hypothetical protein